MEEAKYRDVPMKELEGLTPHQVERLYEELFEEKSPMVVKDPRGESQEEIPLMNLVLHFMEGIEREKGAIKLTQAGYLPTAFVKELYEAGYIMDIVVSEDKKMIKEADVMVAHLARNLCETAGLTHMDKNAIKLTEMGKKFLENRENLFKKIFQNYIEELSWSYFDGLPECEDLQNLAGYILYLVRKYGRKKMSIEFYYNKFLVAFPGIKEEFLKEHSEEDLINVFYLRVFERFLENFGLIEVVEGGKIRSVKDFKVLKTPVFDDIISFNI